MIDLLVAITLICSNRWSDKIDTKLCEMKIHSCYRDYESQSVHLYNEKIMETCTNRVLKK